MSQPTPDQLREAKDEGPSLKRWVLGIAGVILVVFIALNSQEVEVKFIVGSAQMPLIFALAAAAALGALVGWAVPRLRHRGDE